MTATYSRLGAIVSTGTLATADTLYECPAASSAVVNVDVVNRAATEAKYRLCIHTSAAFAAAGYVVYEASVGPNDTIRLGPYVLDATNKYLMCSADEDTVSFTASGVVNA